MYSASSHRSPCRFRLGARPCSAPVSTWFLCRRASRISIRRQNVKDAGIRAIAEGFTKYTTPGSGIIELKEAICRKFERDNGLIYTTDEVIVNNGAKHSLFLAGGSTGQPRRRGSLSHALLGDLPGAAAAGGRRAGDCRDPSCQRPQAHRRRVPRRHYARTRMLFLCSRPTPAARCTPREELESLAAVAVEHGVYVLSDEIYEKLIYDGAEHHSIAACGPEAKEFSIVVNGVSKAYSMTGWRIGYTGASEQIIAGMNKVQSQEVSHPSSMAQKAAVEALNGPQESVEEMRQAFDARRRYMVERLNAIEGVECALPSGAFYAYPDVAAYYGSQVRDLRGVVRALARRGQGGLRARCWVWHLRAYSALLRHVTGPN